MSSILFIAVGIGGIFLFVHMQFNRIEESIKGTNKILNQINDEIKDIK